jgi:signal transduction histidine kinase/HAMP domain-containing protein
VALVSRLFLLVAVALLPAIAIQTYNEFERRRLREAEVQEQALGLAKLAAAEQQQIVQGIRQALIVMAQAPAIKAKDTPACQAYLSTIKEQFPAFLAFLVVDMEGRSFCDTNVVHKPVSLASRAYFANAQRTGGFAVGEFAVGRLTGRKIIQFALPFSGDDGRMGGVISAALGLDWLAAYIARKGVPPGAAIAITDRNGVYLARYPDDQRFVGKKMPDDQHWSGDLAGASDTTDLDGVERIVGHSALPGESGALLVSIGLDKAQAFAAIQRGTQRGILLIVLSTALVLILTSLGARRFVHRPLGQLVEAANQWRVGDYGRRVKIDKGQCEFGRVGDALNTMADALENREGELREAKEKAEEAADRIRTVFESTTDSVLIVDRDWRINYVNARAAMQLAEGRCLVGADLRTVFPEATRSESYRRGRAASEQSPASFETFSSPRDAWYAINAFPSPEGLAVYFRDVTEHKHAVETRRLIEEQLHQSQKMEAMGQLTGGVAHDFNNLLMVVSANLALVEKHATGNERVMRLVATAQQAADRGAKLTGQLLAFSRRQRLNPKVVHADHLIREFEGLMRQAVGDGCELELIIHEPLWPCHVDPTQLETALLNLTLNGRDAMTSGGVLKIEARNAAVEEGTVAGLAPGSYVALSVADTGSGIPPATLERVFEPFFTTKAIGKGTGLGLSMVYGFVRQSGGHVAIESAVGVGTAITLYLPKAATDAGVEATQREPSRKGGNKDPRDNSGDVG